MRISKSKIVAALSDAWLNLRNEYSFNDRSGTIQLDHRMPAAHAAYGAWDFIGYLTNWIQDKDFTEKFKGGSFSSAGLADYCQNRVKIIIEHNCPSVKFSHNVINLTFDDMLKIKDKEVVRKLGQCLALQGIAAYLATGKTEYLSFEGMKTLQQKMMDYREIKSMDIMAP